MEVDANNLYGWAMSQEMPDGDFVWVRQDEYGKMELLMNNADGCIVIFDLGLINNGGTDEEKKSFIFEVDLKYPPELHDREMIICSLQR